MRVIGKYSEKYFETFQPTHEVSRNECRRLGSILIIIM